jgi:hypothetical protein
MWPVTRNLPLWTWYSTNMSFAFGYFSRNLGEGEGGFELKGRNLVPNTPNVWMLIRSIEHSLIRLSPAAYPFISPYLNFTLRTMYSTIQKMFWVTIWVNRWTRSYKTNHLLSTLKHVFLSHSHTLLGITF